MITGDRGAAPAAVLLTTLAMLGTITVTAAPSHAEPAVPASYRITVSDRTVITELENATFLVAENHPSVQVINPRNQVLAALPLTFEVNGHIFALGDRISGDRRTLTLTPDIEAVRRSGPQPVASPMENQVALGQFAGDLTRNLGIGTAVGAILGAALGAAIGLSSCLAVGPACLATAPALIGIFAGAGGVVGTVLGGGAAVADSGWKYIMTLQAEPGQSPYAGEDGTLADGGTGVPDATLRLPSGSAGGLRSGSASGSGP